MENRKTFSNFKELGSFIKKRRRESGERIENISSKLLIKKNILQDIENGLFSQSDYEKNTYLKRFLKTYMKDLKIVNICDVENLFFNNTVDIKQTNVSLDNTKIGKNKFGKIMLCFETI